MKIAIVGSRGFNDYDYMALFNQNHLSLLSFQ
jgi:hypothetical protein